jgi:hypothetical protein
MHAGAGILAPFFLRFAERIKKGLPVNKVKRYTYGRVDFLNWCLGWTLACLAGVGHARTQDEALALCQNRLDSQAASTAAQGNPPGCTISTTESECLAWPGVAISGHTCTKNSSLGCYLSAYRLKEVCDSGAVLDPYYGDELSFSYDSISCHAGEVAFVHVTNATPATMCKGGCSFQSTGDETDVKVDPGALKTGYAKYTNTGQTCSGPDTTWPDGHICNVDTGVCIDYDGDSGHGTFCDSAGNCRDVPETGDGGCSSSDTDAVCGSPGGGDGAGNGGGNGGGTNPNPGAGPANGSGPTPQPPSPPFLPGSAPSNTWTVTVHTQSGSGLGFGDTTSNEGQHQCGGAGQEPCSQGPSACPPGQVMNQIGMCYDPSPHCPAGTTYNGSVCVQSVKCPAGQTYVTGVGCSGGGPTTCPSGTQLIGGQCVGIPHCPAGSSWDDATSQCKGTSGPNCPDGMVADNDGVCHPGTCPAGWTNKDGVCTQNPPACPEGTEEKNGVCVAPCPLGQTEVNGVCEPISSSNCVGGTLSGGGHGGTTCTCPSGQTLVNGVCSSQQPITCVNGLVVQGRCVCPPNYAIMSGVCYYAPGGGGGGGNNGGGGSGGGNTGGGGSGSGGPSGCDAGPACQDSASGGATCDGPAPQCAGDTVSCNALFQAWMTRCIIDPGNGVPSDADVLAAGADPATVQTSNTVDETTFDESGFGMPNDCPTVPDIVVMGATLHFGSPWCDVLAFVGWFVLAGAWLSAIRILAR